MVIFHFIVVSLVLTIALPLVLLTTVIVLKSGKPGCEQQKLLSFSPTVQTTDLYSEDDSFGSYDEEILSKKRSKANSKLPFKAKKISGFLLQAQQRTTASPNQKRTSINRRGRRNGNPNSRMLCNTKIPSCLQQRKDIVKFSETLDVELHYNGIHTKIIMLMCRVS